MKSKAIDFINRKEINYITDGKDFMSNELDTLIRLIRQDLESCYELGKNETKEDFQFEQHKGYEGVVKKVKVEN